MPNIIHYLGHMERLLAEAQAAGKTPTSWGIPHTVYVNASDEPGWVEAAQDVYVGTQAPVDLFQLPTYIIPGSTQQEIRLRCE